MEDARIDVILKLRRRRRQLQLFLEELSACEVVLKADGETVWHDSVDLALMGNYDTFGDTVFKSGMAWHE